MFLLDDLLVRPFVGLLEILHDMAIQERYDLEALRDERKENRLLYEVGDLPREEYERRRDDIEARMEEAREAHERLRRKSVVIQ